MTGIEGSRGIVTREAGDARSAFSTHWVLAFFDRFTYNLPSLGDTSMQASENRHKTSLKCTFPCFQCQLSVFRKGF